MISSLPSKDAGGDLDSSNHVVPNPEGKITYQTKKFNLLILFFVYYIPRSWGDKTTFFSFYCNNLVPDQWMFIDDVNTKVS